MHIGWFLVYPAAWRSISDGYHGGLGFLYYRSPYRHASFVFFVHVTYFDDQRETKKKKLSSFQGDELQSR